MSSEVCFCVMLGIKPQSLDVLFQKKKICVYFCVLGTHVLLYIKKKVIVMLMNSEEWVLLSACYLLGIV